MSINQRIGDLMHQLKISKYELAKTLEINHVLRPPKTPSKCRSSLPPGSEKTWKHFWTNTGAPFRKPPFCSPKALNLVWYHYHRNRFSEAHREALEATGLYGTGVTGYAWKHTGVTNAYLSGVDIVSIQKQCRHHSLAETEKYLRSLGLRFARDLSEANW